MKKVYILLYFVIILLNGCIREQIEDITMLNTDETEPVVFCKLDNFSDSIYAWVGYTIPISDKPFDSLVNNSYEMNAKIIITNSQKDTLFLNRISDEYPIYGCAKGNFKVQANENYYLYTYLSNGTILKSCCSINQTKDSITSIDEHKTIIDSVNQQKYLPLTITIAHPDKSNLCLLRLTKDDIGSGEIQGEEVLDFFDETIYNEDKIIIKDNFNFNFYDAQSEFNYEGQYIKYQLYSFTDEWKIYFQALSLQENLGYDFFSIDNYSGIIPDFSNIQNGKGLFYISLLIDTDSIKINLKRR